MADFTMPVVAGTRIYRPVSISAVDAVMILNRCNGVFARLSDGAVEYGPTPYLVDTETSQVIANDAWEAMLADALAAVEAADK